MEKKIEGIEKKNLFEYDEDEFGFDKLTKEKDLDLVDEALRKKDRDLKLEIVPDLFLFLLYYSVLDFNEIFSFFRRKPLPCKDILKEEMPCLGRGRL